MVEARLSVNARQPNQIGPVLPGAVPTAERGLVAGVVAALGRAIVGGLIQPHHTLPTEVELGLQFGVSRTVVREAARALASKGLLETRARTGTRVRPQEAWHRLDPAVLAWQAETLPHDRFVRELFELRRMIEPEAASFAAARIDPAGLAEVADAYQAMVLAGEDVQAFFAADRLFHGALLRSVGNTLVLALTAAVGQALELSLRLSLPAPRGQQRAIPMHRAVLEAIEQRDPEAARTAMRRLIDDAEEDVHQALATTARPPRPERSGRRQPNQSRR